MVKAASTEKKKRTLNPKMVLWKNAASKARKEMEAEHPEIVGKFLPMIKTVKTTKKLTADQKKMRKLGHKMYNKTIKSYKESIKEVCDK